MNRIAEKILNFCDSWSWFPPFTNFRQWKKSRLKPDWVCTMWWNHFWGRIALYSWALVCSRYNFFLTFPACFSMPIIFSNFDFNSSNLSSLWNLQEQVKKAFCYQELFWPFTVWIHCSSDLKNFENSWPSASNFKSFS